MKKSKSKEAIEKTVLEKYHRSQELNSILKRENPSKGGLDGSESTEIVPENPVDVDEQQQAEEVFDEIDALRKESNKKFLKLKKKLKKQKRNQGKIETPGTKDNDAENPKERKSDKALAYLKQWKRHREDWKFKKILNIWLSRNWKDSDKFPDKRFKTFLKYLRAQDARSNSVKRIQQEAQKLIENSQTPEKIVERSRSILQWLT